MDCYGTKAERMFRHFATIMVREWLMFKANDSPRSFRGNDRRKSRDRIFATDEVKVIRHGESSIANRYDLYHYIPKKRKDACCSSGQESCKARDCKSKALVKPSKCEWRKKMMGIYSKGK